jgi:membrane-associated protease RseP (regulator of RpoE activity)
MFDISSEREQNVRSILEGVMNISEIGSEQFRVTVLGDFLIPLKEAIATVKERALSHELMPLFRRRGERILIQFVPKLKPPQKSNYTVNVVLFILTIFTTMFAGALQQGVNPILQIYKGIPFSFAIILILGSHELGHYYASRRLGIAATPPYFIPFPHLIGTFGAVIKVKEPITNRKALMEIGAAGPLIGLVFSIPAVIIGLRLSTVIPVSESGLGLGNSLFFNFLVKSVIGDIPEGMDVLLHPVAFAGWIGLFVTALNLLPIGQLDGGHIMYSLIGKYQKWIGWCAFVSLFFFGFFWQGWFLWAIVILVLIKIKHPPPLDDISSIPTSHRIVGVVSMVLLILLFIPSPFILSEIS